MLRSGSSSCSAVSALELELSRATSRAVGSISWVRPSAPAQESASRVQRALLAHQRLEQVGLEPRAPCSVLHDQLAEGVRVGDLPERRAVLGRPARSGPAAARRRATRVRGAHVAGRRRAPAPAGACASGGWPVRSGGQQLRRTPRRRSPAGAARPRRGSAGPRQRAGVKSAGRRRRGERRELGGDRARPGPGRAPPAARGPSRP